MDWSGFEPEASSYLVCKCKGSDLPLIYQPVNINYSVSEFKFDLEESSVDF